MSSKVRLLLIFLAIPLMALATASGVEWKLDSTLRDALRKQYPEETAWVAHVSVSTVCRNYELRSKLIEMCNLSDNMARMKVGAIVAAILGLALLISIKIAGNIARGSRILLLAIFAPGLHLTMLALSALMILHATLGIAAVYYGASIFANTVPVGFILALGFGAVVGVLAMLRAQFSTIRKATITVLGKKLEPQEHPKIWKFITELAQIMGAGHPHAIVAGLEPNFYVTEANIVCLDGKLRGRTMYVSVPLCRILSLDEMKAVLSHELAHYKGLDTRFSQRFYPIYRGATQGLSHIAQNFSEKGGASSMVLMPAFITLTYFLNAFSESEKEISRERELAADNEAAKVDNAHNLATALVKFHAFSPAWLTIRQGMKQALGKGKVYVNASALFAEIANGVEKDKALSAVSEEGPVHPTDSHPPLSHRLKNLNLTLEQVTKDASDTSPAKPAASLLENMEELERNLTEVEHAVMVRTGEAKIGGEPMSTEVAQSEKDTVKPSTA